jgi:hypothetical protein
MLAVLAVICFAICKEANTCLLYLEGFSPTAICCWSHRRHPDHPPLLDTTPLPQTAQGWIYSREGSHTRFTILRETGEGEIVGLPATGSTKLYVLPVKDVHGESDGPLGFVKLGTAKHFIGTMAIWQIQYLWEGLGEIRTTIIVNRMAVSGIWCN